MSCTVCPNCGLDLERFAPVQRGDLEIQPYAVRWKGRVVQLRPAGRLLVSTIARGDGLPISLNALSEALGCEDSVEPDDLIRTQVCFARKAFRETDPSFDAIKTVWGAGFRWAA